MLAYCIVFNLALASGDPARDAVNHLGREVHRLAADQDIVGLAVCVASRDRVLMRETIGRTRYRAGAAIEPGTRFRIASLSKGFASTVTAQLVNEGKLAWNNRIIDSVGYFSLQDPAEAQRAELQHLLSHRIGLPHNAYDKLLEANWDTEAIVRRYQTVDPMCTVGTCYGYQNIGYNLISNVIETQTGRDFETQVTERLFRPLALQQASFGRMQLRGSGNWARPHIGRKTRLHAVEVKSTYYRLPASAGINASVDDMCLWLQAQLGASPQLIPTALREELWTPRVETRRELFRGRWRRARLRAAHYGLGWRIYDYQGHRLIFHAGSVQGYGATIGVLPERDVGLVVLWNSEARRPWSIVPAFVDRLLGLGEADWLRLAELEQEISTSTTARAPAGGKR